MPWSVRQTVEIVHLVFLAELGGKLDHALYAVKGGCNLRFFFGSPRYSEDLDLDVRKAAPQTLRHKVDQVLAGRSLRLTLGAHGIELTAVSSPKQTDTTQRWKLALSHSDLTARTKIEFSRRGLQPGVEFGPVHPVLVRGYGLSGLLVSHYGAQAAFDQKLAALVGRAQTQARDVFDLALLLATVPGLRASLTPAQRRAASERALAVDFGTFRSQVLAFLPIERQRDYGSEQLWNQLVLRVVEALEQP